MICAGVIPGPSSLPPRPGAGCLLGREPEGRWLLIAGPHIQYTCCSIAGSVVRQGDETGLPPIGTRRSLEARGRRQDAAHTTPAGQVGAAGELPRRHPVPTPGSRECTCMAPNDHVTRPAQGMSYHDTSPRDKQRAHNQTLKIYLPRYWCLCCCWVSGWLGPITTCTLVHGAQAALWQPGLPRPPVRKRRQRQLQLHSESVPQRRKQTRGGSPSIARLPPSTFCRP